MLRRYTWESQKQKLQHYKRRQPETSVLYQLVYHSRDDLECQWESRFQHEYGVLRDEVTKTLDKLSIQDDIVTYTTKDNVAHEFDALEFLAKLATTDDAEITESDYRREFTKSSWAACVKRIYEIDPLECPKCKAQMRIIAFIQDTHSIKNIMNSQGIKDFQASPPIPRFIDTSEAIDELPFEPSPDDL